MPVVVYHPSHVPPPKSHNYSIFAILALILSKHRVVVGMMIVTSMPLVKTWYKSNEMVKSNH